MNTVRIECRGATEVNIAELYDLQGNLKILTDENYAKLRNSITEFGFSFPVFIWEDPMDNKKYILDAHQRIRTLRKMQEEGYSVPPLPADYIHAKDRVEAKKKLLLVASHYGEITEEGLYEFMNEEGLEINAEEMEDFVEIDEFDKEYADDEESEATKEKKEICAACKAYHDRNHTEQQIAS